MLRGFLLFLMDQQAKGKLTAHLNPPVAKPAEDETADAQGAGLVQPQEQQEKMQADGVGEEHEEREGTDDDSDSDDDEDDDESDDDSDDESEEDDAGNDETGAPDAEENPIKTYNIRQKYDEKYEAKKVPKLGVPVERVMQLTMEEVIGLCRANPVVCFSFPLRCVPSLLCPGRHHSCHTPARHLL